MQRKFLAAFMGLGLLTIVAVPIEAHHSFAAEFDANKPVTLQGSVTKVEWVNPHIWIHVDVKNPDGTVVTWAVEGAAPNSMIRRGVLKTSVPIGTQVTVNGFLAKSGRPVANGRDIQWAGGGKMFMGSSGTGAPEDGADKPKR